MSVSACSTAGFAFADKGRWSVCHGTLCSSVLISYLTVWETQVLQYQCLSMISLATLILNLLIGITVYQNSALFLLLPNGFQNGVKIRVASLQHH